jgi:hypothetical protein
MNINFINNNLPNKVYNVRVSRLASMSESELKHQGYSNTIINGKVQSPEMDMITTYINIDRMIDLYSKNSPIYLLNNDEVFEIYESLCLYLDRLRHNMI